MTLSDHQFETEIRPEWIEAVKRTNAFEKPDDFSMDWKAYYRALPKGRDVLRAIALKSGLSVKRLKGDSQDRRVAPWRHLAIYVCVEYLEFSLSKAARIVGKEHSIARYALDSFKDRLGNDKRWRKNLEDVLRGIA